MPLEKICEKYKNCLVFILPVEGFGWSRASLGASEHQPGDWMEPPAPFRGRISELHYFRDMIQAGVGTIETPNHPLGNMWVAFCLRDRGQDMYNLTTKPGKYNLCISETRPSITTDPEKLATPEWIQFKGLPYLSGLGYITESEISLEEILRQTPKK